MLFSGRVSHAHNSGAKVIECSTEIVNCITDDECERFRNWFEWVITHAISGRFHVGRNDAWLDLDRVEILGKRARKFPQFINVAIGPLNL
jgi:uncharacterized protein YfaT (DUF1175 family)